MGVTGVDGIGSWGGTDNPLLTYVSNNNPAIPQQAEGAKGGTQADGWNPQPLGWNASAGQGGAGTTQQSGAGGQQTAQLAPFTAFFRPGPIVTPETVAPRAPIAPRLMPRTGPENLAPRTPIAPRPIPQTAPQGTGLQPPAPPVTVPPPGANLEQKPDPKPGRIRNRCPRQLPRQTTTREPARTSVAGNRKTRMAGAPTP